MFLVSASVPSHIQASPSAVMSEILGKGQIQRIFYNSVVTDNDIVLEFLMPGLKREQISVKLDKNILVVESSPEVEEAKEGVRRNLEWKINKQKTAIELPSVADLENIQVKYDAGVLYVTIGKKNIGEAKSFEIL